MSEKLGQLVYRKVNYDMVSVVSHTHAHLLNASSHVRKLMGVLRNSDVCVVYRHTHTRTSQMPVPVWTHFNL